MTSSLRIQNVLSCLALSVVLIASLAAPSFAFETPTSNTPAEQLAFDDPGMYVLNYYEPIDALPLAVQQAVSADLISLGVLPSNGYYDLRADRWGSLILTVPLVPGAGVGNALSWADLGLAEPQSDAELGQAARRAFEDFLTASSSQLKIDPAELGSGKVTVHESGRLIQINLNRVAGGVPVEGSWVHGVVNSGNLILFGTRNWGDINLSTAPTASKDQAVATVSDYVAPAGPVTKMRSPTLKFYAMKNGDTPSQANLGTGFDYRLTWEVQLSLAGSHGTWRALVDADSGELYSFADQNRYATRKVTGGVQPVSNDGTCEGDQACPAGTLPDGIEQPGWPMPFADIWINRAPGAGQPDAVTNSGGVLACVDGSIATRLAGPLVRMNDNCGAANESVAAGDLDLGAGATAGLAPWMNPWGTDCARPLPASSAGNTHSSRDGFYEVNRIKEMARGWLPDNFWLTGQLTANMNINNTCNAFWNGSTINFYRESNSSCGNTGEIAAVFDHEWGHGMDANDAVPGISFPGETIADQYAMYRLNTSCIGRGFFLGALCSGFGDPCTGTCNGVREVDWALHDSGRPHNITWIKQPFATPDNPLAPRGGCVGFGPAIPGIQAGPCQQIPHCEGQVVSEAVWDLMHRELAGFEGSPFNLDVNTRLNLVTRLGYLGGGNVNFWFQCVDTPEDGTGGCNPDSGYMQFLAVDDDNGNLLDGTPHMSAIHTAFSRHQLACPAPIVADFGCAAVPATPNLTATPLDNGAEITWDAVAGATEYWLFRGDGFAACEFGKELIAVTTDTQYVDNELVNGREYYYTVEAVGGTMSEPNESCRSAASACQAVTPTAGANLKIQEGSVQTDVLGGDGDQFLDNCETAQVNFELENSGNLSLTDVQIVSVESPSHPLVSAAEILPIDVAASLADCDTAPASLTITGAGLAFGDTLLLRVGFTAFEFGGVVRTETIEIQNTESDFNPVPSHTFAFNNFSDLEGWELVVGNYDQLPGGPPADPAGFFLASSAFLPDQCDAIQSPLIKLTPTSTLSLYNQYDTEPPLPVFGGTYYDRANIGILHTASGVRTPIVPDGGRLYDIPAGQAAGGSCFTTNQRGWSNIGQFPWAESTWSAGALQAPSFAGNVVRLHVAYGTDPLVQGAGFQFDFVNLTDIEMQGPDQQPDAPCDLCPVAVDDSATTPFDTPVTIDVSDNDFVNDTALTVTSVTDPPKGSAVINDPGVPDNDVTYTPNSGCVGIDDFDYTVCNNSCCNAATVTVTVECPAEPSGSFSDDFEPAAEAGWTVQTQTNNIPTSTTWTVAADPLAQSPTNSYFSDASSPDLKDDRLVSPPMDLSATSQLIFWHRFNTEPTFDGGVLEVSTNGGANWADVGAGNFVTGGYNDVIDPGFGSPIANRAAWTGLSQFVDAMNQVTVNLGGFAGNGVLVRWRLVLDPFVPGSIPGEAWKIDDVQFTNLNQVPETCDLACAFCGDGTVDPGEECDDGNNTNGDGCSATCEVEAFCGDGTVDPGEECDDGNNTNGDGCSATCEIEGFCGDGNLDPGEECDDGNNRNGDGCSSECTIEDSFCGDGTVDAGEECDDGNNQNGDGCSASCTLEECGNGILDEGEQCDDGNNQNGDGCSASCTIEACGNGVLDEGEQCDDGNTDPGDGCSASCTIEECGNGVLDPGEQCDDGNTTDGDGCSASCRLEECGDGNLDAGEECDDGNTDGGDGCSASCTIEECGNGTVDVGEECDDGNTDGGDGCSATCTIEVCGNGILDAGEECDDGNNQNGDGCSATCEVEPFCGDGNVDPGEECDDGNNNNGDGCSATCEVEAFCGDGNVDPGEECDDGNNDNGDGCSATCEVEPFCGDGNVDPGEECDDGNNTDGDGCSATCEVEAFCGDGNVDPGEECDDGNNDNGDGCTAFCTIETASCGDGTVDRGEECDDGNNDNGDGCSATCTVEGPPCDYCADDGDSDSETELALTYFGGDCSNSDNTQGSKAECTDFAGPPPSDQTVFVVVSSKEDSNSDSDDEFFRGPIDPGQGFLATAAFAGKDDLPSKVFVHIFDNDTESGGVILQTNEIHTSCSAPMIEGERFGAVALGDADNPGECTDVATGRVHGSGRLNVHLGPGDDEDSDTDADSDSDDDSDSDKIDFSFDAKVKKGELEGKLKMKDKEFDIKIDADKDGITSLNTGTGDCNGQALGANSWEFTAVGTFEQGGVETPSTFRVCGEDNGKPGKGNDRFFLECTSGCAYDTGSRVPDDVLDGGNIHIHDAIGGGA